VVFFYLILPEREGLCAGIIEISCEARNFNVVHASVQEGTRWVNPIEIRTPSMALKSM
jgi:hypothetical protein